MTLLLQNICLPLFGFYRSFIDLTLVIKQMATGEGGYSSSSAEQNIYPLQLMQQVYLSLPHFFSVFVQLSRNLKLQIFTFKLYILLDKQ